MDEVGRSMTMKKKIDIEDLIGRAYLDSGQRETLRRHLKNKTYDANGTQNKALPVVKRVLIPSNHQGRAVLLVLCRIGKPDRQGGFDFVVFRDGLYGKGHFPSDHYGFGPLKDAVRELEDHAFYELVGVHRWVVKEKGRELRDIMGAVT